MSAADFLSTAVHFARSTVGRIRRRALLQVRPLVGPECLHDPPRGVFKTLQVVAERAAMPHVRPSAVVERLPPPPNFDVIGVYRQRNAAQLAELIASGNGIVALWALDRVDPVLRTSTIGVGPGTRFENLNRVVGATDRDHWLVVADDDVTMTLGTLAQAVSLASAAGLDVCMPGHDSSSHVNWEVTRSRPQDVVRLTRFVDQGPLVIFSPAARKLLLPFDESMGMGWGVELTWGVFTQLRVGILDAVRLHHLSPVSRTGAYDIDVEMRRGEAVLAASPWSTWAEAQAVQARWRRTRRSAPWLS